MALTLGNRGWRWPLGCIALGYVYTNACVSVLKGILKVKLPTIWTDEKAEVGKVREEKRREEKRREEEEKRREEKRREEKRREEKRREETRRDETRREEKRREEKGRERKESEDRRCRCAET